MVHYFRIMAMRIEEGRGTTTRRACERAWFPAQFGVFRLASALAGRRAAFLCLLLSACGHPQNSTSVGSMPVPETSTTFGTDLAFLRAHTDVLTLASADGKAQVAIVPKYQGRVMTSTADGADGLSFG